ncbi:hypothetical protein [Pontiella sulfatireligans]|uniref:Uncharacterized protein n=1 Tax=Pontiella sulfatireligans TaxID=2750658 RepID=A0A6C2UH20_9BACT|nr:hypothetical protein [Pontiella sulfatireligans]VGO18654.1 hypothetical protein SCARR_00707 [Pontiella sulfatireligans]
MKKTAVIQIAILAFAVSASAAVLEDWQMNDIDGRKVTKLNNDAGTATFATANAGVTVTNGHLRASYFVSNYGLLSNAELTTPDLTSGSYTVETKFISGSTVNSNGLGGSFTVGLSDINGDDRTDLWSIGLINKAEGLRLQVKVGTTRTDVHYFNSHTLTNDLVVRAVVDLDNDLLDVYYTIGTNSEQSSLDLSVNDGAVDVVRLNVGNQKYVAGDHIEIDYLTFSDSASTNTGPANTVVLGGPNTRLAGWWEMSPLPKDTGVPSADFVAMDTNGLIFTVSAESVNGNIYALNTGMGVTGGTTNWIDSVPDAESLKLTLAIEGGSVSNLSASFGFGNWNNPQSLSVSDGTTTTNLMGPFALDVDVAEYGAGNVLENLTALSETNISTWSIHFTGNAGTTNGIYLRSLILSYDYAGGTALPYSQWALDHDLVGAGAGYAVDPDKDGYNNLYEYALGGNPTNAAEMGISPTIEGLDYVYIKRKTATTDGLNYNLELTPNLAIGTWTNDTSKYAVTGTGEVDSDFDAVTNRISTAADDQQYIQLRIIKN